MRIYVKSKRNCTELNGFKLLQTSRFSQPFQSSHFSFSFCLSSIYGSRVPDVIVDVPGSFPFKMFIGPWTSCDEGNVTWSLDKAKFTSPDKGMLCIEFTNCFTQIRLQLEDPRLDVVVLLTQRLWCGRVSGDVVVSARFSQFVNGKSTKKMSLCERNHHSAPATYPEADKTKQKRRTEHQELIRCGWWQGAVSANTRGVQSKQTRKETTKIKKSNSLPVF